MRLISIIIAIIVSLLVYISVNNIDLNKPTNKKLTQTVTVETFVPITNDKNKPYQASTNTGCDLSQDFMIHGAKSFCENHRGKSSDLNTSCKMLTNDNCTSSDCCVLVQGQNGNTCMAGNVNGPTFKKDKDGKMISMDAYYFQGQKYPKPISM